jgi:hypothetical protein
MAGILESISGADSLASEQDNLRPVLFLWRRHPDRECQP